MQRTNLVNDMENPNKLDNTNELDSSIKSSSAKETNRGNSIIQNDQSSGNNEVPTNIAIDNDNIQQINDLNYENDSDQAGK